jgi:hypothetical protein
LNLLAPHLLFQVIAISHTTQSQSFMYLLIYLFIILITYYTARGKKRAEIREIWGLPTPDITYDDSGDVIRNDENFKFLSHVE